MNAKAITLSEPSQTTPPGLEHRDWELTDCGLSTAERPSWTMAHDGQCAAVAADIPADLPLPTPSAMRQATEEGTFRPPPLRFGRSKLLMAKQAQDEAEEGEDNKRAHMLSRALKTTRGRHPTNLIGCPGLAIRRVASLEQAGPRCDTNRRGPPPCRTTSPRRSRSRYGRCRASGRHTGTWRPSVGRSYGEADGRLVGLFLVSGF